MNTRRLWIFLVCILGSASVRGLDPGGAVPASAPASMSLGAQRFAVHSGRDGRPSHYIPSGYMGDAGNLALSGAYITSHDGTGTPLRVTYRPSGPKGWAGLYWQHPANNWGDRPGRTGYDLRGAARLSFWARGEKGGEKIHEIRVGGIVGRYPDSDSIARGPIQLTKDWQKFEIDLADLDLRHIIGGFAFSLTKRENAGDVVFYIDDIGFEMAQAAVLPKPEGKVVESTGESKLSMQPPAVIPKDLRIKAEDAGLRVSFSSQFLFSSGKAALRPESAQVLNQVADVLKAYPKNDVLVEGHTDATGTSEGNLTLSRLRAESVRDYLIKQGGFALQRFRVVGYGQTKPIEDNATRGGRVANRRVEVIILKAPEKL